jgi:hypothetical protein
MTRRDFIAVLGGAAAAWPLAARAQQDSRIRALQTRILLLQAEGAAALISDFFVYIESHLGWTTQLPWSAPGAIDQRRFDGLRLLRQVPAITEFVQLDADGKERLSISRFAAPVVGSGADLSKEPKFVEAVANKVYYGPVYFRRQSEPFMTIAVAGQTSRQRDAGVSVAEVGLKPVWDVVSQIKPLMGGWGGGQGYVADARRTAYVVDAQGRLIAHPDLKLVLLNCPSQDYRYYGMPASCYADMSKLAHVRAALGGTIEPVQEGEDIEGRKVLTAHAWVRGPGWLVFVELPVEEVNAPDADESRPRSLPPHSGRRVPTR